MFHTDRARFAGARISLDHLPERTGNLRQRQRALGVVGVTFGLLFGAGRYLTCVFRQQPTLDVGDDQGNRLSLGHVDAGLGRFPGPVVGPMVAQAVRQAGGDMQLPALATGGNKQLAATGQQKDRCPMALVAGRRLQLELSGNGMSGGLLIGGHNKRIMGFVVYFVNYYCFDHSKIPLYAPTMARTTSRKAPDYTETINSIFTARRDLLHGVKAAVKGSLFTVEEADLLISLYGARDLGWTDLEHDTAGYVTYRQLESFLVHNASLLSRRIIKLASARPALVEVADGDVAAGQHFNSKRVRITDHGAKAIAPVWQRYQAMSAELLRGIKDDQRIAHHAVNTAISQRIRERRDGLHALFTGGK